MATTTAWTDRYVPILRESLGLAVEVGPEYLQVHTGNGLHYRLRTDPDTAPHHLEIAFSISLRSHTELLINNPTLLAEITTRLTARPTSIKALPTGTDSCVLLIEADLAVPGTLPDPHLLAGLLPVQLAALAETFHDLHTELEAAALYTA